MAQFDGIRVLQPKIHFLREECSILPANRRPPSPPGRWPLGNLPEFRRDLLGFFTRTAREYGDLVAMRLGPRLVHLASHPDFVEQVLVTEYKKFGKSYVFELLRPVLGNGLVNSEGDFWLRQRRLIQPAFNKSSVNSYAGIITTQCDRIMGEWNDRQSIDLHGEMSRLALGMVGKALMDMDLTDVKNEVTGPIDSAMRDFSHRFESMINLPMWVPTRRNLRAKRNVRKLDAIVHRIIQQRRASGDRGDLLSKLIQARDEVDKSGMTDRQLRDEVMTLFLAGHETTANALTWTWFLIAQHPEIENRLLEEVRNAIGDRTPGAADLPKLPYTEAVIKEAMRLYPPVYAFSRRVLVDAEIGGFQVPAGSAVIMSQWVIHHDPRWYNDPDEFKPERWLAANNGAAGQKERPDYAYFPFGGGPRGCIGNTFAMLETILAVAAIVPRFRFELIAPEKVRPWPSVTLRPAAGVPGIVHRRNAAISSLEPAATRTTLG
jgi:cytochrome P450